MGTDFLWLVQVRMKIASMLANLQYKKTLREEDMESARFHRTRWQRCMYATSMITVFFRDASEKSFIIVKKIYR